MKKKSLSINTSLNVIRRFVSMFFPLIIFPYITRILNVENVGKVNFAANFINYFVLLASLGIPIYASREGAKKRNDKKIASKFISEVFSINVLSSFISIALLIIIVYFVPYIRLYWKLIAIESLLIVSTTIGMDWFFVIYEDFLYVTIRTVVAQVISLVLIFTFIKQEKDYYTYAFITVLSQMFVSIYNFIRAKKSIRFKIFIKPCLTNHIKPIITIFALNVSSQIYINADTTMIGLMIGDYAVGLYSVANKVYRILKTLIASIFDAALPNLSNTIAIKGLDDYKKKVNRVIDLIIVILMPIMIGTLCTAKDIIIVLSGPLYIEAVTSLRILSISLLGAMLSGFYMYAVLLPMGKEKTTMQAMTVSAILNIILNFYFIPYYWISGAAMTTLISEFLVYFWQRIALKNENPIKFNINNITTTIVGCLIIYIVCFLISYVRTSPIFILVMKAGISAILYFLTLVLLNNKLLLEYKNILMQKIKRGEK